MVTLDDIKIYLDTELGIDILTKSNKRKYVYGRALLSKLAIEFIKRENGKPITLYHIADFLKSGSHASVLRYIKVNFKDIETFEPEYLKIYNDFKEITFFEELTSDLDFNSRYNVLLKKYVELNTKLNDMANIKRESFEDKYLNEVVSMAKKISNGNRELFLMRIKPIAKMVNSTVY